MTSSTTAQNRFGSSRFGLKTMTLGVAALLMGYAQPAWAQINTPGPATWGRLKDPTPVRNFGDANGAELTRLDAGRVVRIFGTTSGIPPFHEVEVAGGVPVWVYGELLQPTAVDGVLRVDASHVNMRPYPESSPRSMALRSKLQRGTRVLLIERRNPSLPLAQDWVKIWAPETARVWVEAAQVQSLTTANALDAAQTDWLQGRRVVPTMRQAQRKKERQKQAAEVRRDEDVAAAPKVPAGAIRMLTEANTAFDSAMQVADPNVDDWLPILAQYKSVHGLAPEASATAQAAMTRMTEVELRLGVAEMRDRMRVEDQRRQEELERIARDSAKEELRKTVHWGRFQGRGWLESRVIGGERRFYIVWSGETTAEVRCSSARYDLRLFEGYELGLLGTTVSPPVESSATSQAMPRVLDIFRIEVLSGSAQR